ncbi:hypothetical protein D3C81_781060 [compost metagenome]
MCCDNWSSKPEGVDEVLTECPKCGEPAVYNTQWKEYSAVDHCNYSTVDCDLCGYAPCDQSC